MDKKIKLFLFVVLFACLTYITQFLLKNIVTSAFKDLTLTLVNEDIETIQSVYASRIETIMQINKDWATWDDTYQFVQDLNKDFEESNLVDQALKSANINLILFFDRDGFIVYKKSGSLGGKGDTSIPAEIFNYTTNNKNIDIKEVISNGVAKNGFLSTTTGTFMYSVSPILKSDDTGPSMGAIMMARYVNNLDLLELRKTTNHEISFLDPQSLGDKFSPNISLKLFESGPHIVQTNTGYSVYILTKDSWGVPSTVIHMQHPFMGMDFVNIIVQYSTILLVVIALFVAYSTFKISNLKFGKFYS